MIDVFCCTTGDILHEPGSVRAIVDVLEEGAECSAAEHRIAARAAQFGKRVDEGADACVGIVRVPRVTGVNAGVCEHGPHVELRRRVCFPPEVRLEGGELLGRSGLSDDVEAP